MERKYSKHVQREGGRNGGGGKKEVSWEEGWKIGRAKSEKTGLERMLERNKKRKRKGKEVLYVKKGREGERTREGEIRKARNEGE